MAKPSLHAVIFLGVAVAFSCGRRPAVSHEIKAEPAPRLALGKATEYEAKAFTAVEQTHLNTSIAARRLAAWKIVADVLKPVRIASASTTSNSMTLPKWTTWYSKQDFERMFRKLYGNLTANERHSRNDFSPMALQAVEDWNASYVHTLPNWSEERLTQWFASLNSPSKWNGLLGTVRTLYSPTTLRHVLENYNRVAKCTTHPVDDDQDADHVGVEHLGRSNCYKKEFPANAVAVKASWARSDFGLKIPRFDTSAEAMTTRVSDSEGRWQADGELDVNADTMYSLTTEAGGNFHLTGLHIASKQASDWLWITLWWSDTPDRDFGEDRPDFVKDLGEPWSHYKMCVTTAYTETPPGPDDAAFFSANPSLARVLTALQQGNAPHSWCSNPYIEEGTSNHVTNCIGCHQHAGLNVLPETILGDSQHFPAHGRTKQRQTFPTDYLWSITAEPENLGGLIETQIQFHDIND